MFHFIPAWYGSARPWYDPTTPWYRGVSEIKFDDSINQMQMFQKAGEDMKIMVLNYMPNLRYFLHRYDLFEVSSWSVFDEIQNLHQIEPTIIDFKEFAWFEDVEFLYTPFLVVARKGKDILAHVEFGEESHLIHIQFFKEGRPSKRLVFDDRGFLSSILYYDREGQESHQDYLNRVGEWQIREDRKNHSIQVNPSVANRFQRSSYTNMAELIAEKVTNYIAGLLATDKLVLASHEQHNRLILDCKGEQQVILSYFENRYPLDKVEQLRQEMQAAHLILTDKQSIKEHLTSYSKTPIQHISLFDARLSLGKSQRLQELYIYFLFDNLTESDLLYYCDQIFYLMQENKDIHLKLISYQTSGQDEVTKKEWVKTFLESYDEPFFMLEDEKEVLAFEEEEDEEELNLEIEEKRVSLEFLHSDLEIMTSLEESRLIVDLRPEPDLYTQIAGISTGIPQINRVTTEFVEHLKNGYIIEQDADLATALNYYLTGLRHWNESLMYATQKIAVYTSGSLVEKIKQSIDYE